MFRSSLPEVFSEKVVLKNFAKFTVKKLCKSLFFLKVAGFRPASLLKKTLAYVLSCEFCKISKNTFFKEDLRWLLLHVLRKQCSIKIVGLLKKAVPQNNCSSVAVKIVYFCIMEAVTRRCSVKKVFLKSSQRLQKNTCAGSSFNRVASL